MTTKGQKYITYSLELKKIAIEMRPNGMTKKQVEEELGIQNSDRLKDWMRMYKAEVEFWSGKPT
jgi:transposase